MRLRAAELSRGCSTSCKGQREVVVSIFLWRKVMGSDSMEQMFGSEIIRERVG